MRSTHWNIKSARIHGHPWCTCLHKWTACPCQDLQMCYRTEFESYPWFLILFSAYSLNCSSEHILKLLAIPTNKLWYQYTYPSRHSHIDLMFSKHSVTFWSGKSVMLISLSSLLQCSVVSKEKSAIYTKTTVPGDVTVVLFRIFSRSDGSR